MPSPSLEYYPEPARVTLWGLERSLAASSDGIVTIDDSGATALTS